ncbi:MAG: hypothetical protein H7829_05635 [Magnetococcus sp. THC-1_WYH]
MFFAEGAKNITLRRAPCAFFPQKKKHGKNASGVGAREKQNQNQNPGGNPPDPFFLLIIYFSVPFGVGQGFAVGFGAKLFLTVFILYRRWFQVDALSLVPVSPPVGR